MNNNTLLAVTTVALVFTGTSTAANSDNLIHSQAPIAIEKVLNRDVVSFIGNSTKCTPPKTGPECHPNDDYMCVAA